MVVLILIGLLFGAGYLVGRSSTKTPQITSEHLQRLQAIFDLAQDEINQTYQSKKPSSDTLIFLYAIQYLTTANMTHQSAFDQARAYVTSVLKVGKSQTQQSSADVSTQPATASSAAQQVATKQTTAQYAEFVQAPPQRKPVDVTSQLLYFGAFLLITSIALFVSFAEVQGGLKVFLVALVACILYGAGDYLYRHTKSLIVVGSAFIAIALITIPFIGVSTHLYILDKEYPALVWMATSIVSFAAYLISIKTYRAAFMGYLLIGSSVSSLLSVVQVLTLPTHVFFWVLIATGLLLKLFSTRHNSDDLIAKPAEQFANVLVPIALFTSLLSVSLGGNEREFQLLFTNSGQFAVSLALTALYSYTGSKTEQDEATAENYATTVHPLSIAAVTVGVYSYDNSFLQMGIFLQLLTAIYTIKHFVMPKLSPRFSYEPTVLAVAFIGIFSVAAKTQLVIAGVGLLIVLAISLAYSTRQAWYAVLASTSWIVLSILVGQLLLSPRMTLIEQSLFTSAASLVLLLSAIMMRIRFALSDFAQPTETVAIIGVFLSLILALTTAKEDFIALFAAIWFSLLLIYWLVARKLSKVGNNALPQNTWLLSAYILLYVSQLVILMIPTGKSISYDVSATLAALAASILGALLTRDAWARWASAAQWLLTPVVLAYTHTLGLTFSLLSMTLLYFIAAFFLMGSRLIALGRVQESLSKKPIVSLMKGESSAYLFGYLASLGVISTYALFSDYSSTWQAVILTAVTISLVWYSSFVERFVYAQAIIPIAVQVIIGRLFWHSASSFTEYTVDDAKIILPIISSMAAIIVYSYFNTLTQQTQHKEISPSLSGALKLTVGSFFFSPLYSQLFLDLTWSMAVGLIVAGAALLHYLRQRAIASREVAGAVITVGLMWFLAELGVENIIVHVHIVVALLALYSIIRESRGDLLRSRSYSMAAVIALAAPLVIAALNNEGIYSLLLLIEMSSLFIIGLFIGRKHVHRTGLYVSVGALAYQLRSYGYAVVALIAIVVIGFAIHSAIKQDRSNK